MAQFTGAEVVPGSPKETYYVLMEYDDALDHLSKSFDFFCPAPVSEEYSVGGVISVGTFSETYHFSKGESGMWFIIYETKEGIEKDIPQSAVINRIRSLSPDLLEYRLDTEECMYVIWADEKVQ